MDYPGPILSLKVIAPVRFWGRLGTRPLVIAITMNRWRSLSVLYHKIPKGPAHFRQHSQYLYTPTVRAWDLGRGTRNIFGSLRVKSPCSAMDRFLQLLPILYTCQAIVTLMTSSLGISELYSHRPDSFS